MPTTFSYDVIIRQVTADSVTAEDLAQRLVRDGIRVWFFPRHVRPGDKFIENLGSGLQTSRTMLLCLSSNMTEADWHELEADSFWFRDPQDNERRFLPLCLDDTPLPPSLAQFASLDWRPQQRETTYARLLEACRPIPVTEAGPETAAGKQRLKKILSLGHTNGITAAAFSPDSRTILTSSYDHTLRLWDTEGLCLQVFEDEAVKYLSLAWKPDGRSFISGSSDGKARIWDVNTGQCSMVLEGHTGDVSGVAWSPDDRFVLSGSLDGDLRIWDAATGACLRHLIGDSWVCTVSWSPDGRRLCSGSFDSNIHIWDSETGQHLQTLRGREEVIHRVAWSPDGQRIASASSDQKIRIWEMPSGKCVAVLQKHTDEALDVAWGPDGRSILSAGKDGYMITADFESSYFTYAPIHPGHGGHGRSVAWSPNGYYLFGGSANGRGVLCKLAKRPEDIIDPAWRKGIFYSSDTKNQLILLQGHEEAVSCCWISKEGHSILTGSADNTIRLWATETGKLPLPFRKEHTNAVYAVQGSPDGRLALSSSADRDLRLWDLSIRDSILTLTGHTRAIHQVDWSPDGNYALSASSDKTIRLWNIKTQKKLVSLVGHTKTVTCVKWSPDGRYALSGSGDHTLRLWNINTRTSESEWKGHTGRIHDVAWSPDGKFALSGSADNTLRVWEVQTGRCLQILEGHTGGIGSVAWSPDGKFALSGGLGDNSVRVWEIAFTRCLVQLKGHTEIIITISWSGDGQTVYSVGANGVMRCWDMSDLTGSIQPLQPGTTQVRYTNAKVLLVGESGVGKTGLANYLAGKEFTKTLSTDGAWATHCPLPAATNTDGIEREIWLWDFAGQVDYRLVHQLFMDDAAAAVLLFNPQQENPFDGLGHWDRDLQKATRKPFARLLAAGRIDCGGLVVSKISMERFMEERGFLPPLHLTSALTGQGCETLREAIVAAIDWKDIPFTGSSALYYRLKQEILRLRNNSLTLLHLAELKQQMNLALADENFSLKELETVVSLLSGPGIIQRYDDTILLRPELLSRYAAAVVRKVRSQPDELGYIEEDDLLAGRLDYQHFERLPARDETIILRILHETLLQRAWCLRQPSDGKTLLIFPSYFRRQRPEQNNHPNTLVTYRFTGPVDDIYSTLVVRLHHTTAFTSDQLWKDAADFRTQTGLGLGFKLTREPEGSSRLEVYFQPTVDENSRLIFLRYVHDHLLATAQNIARLRHYFCQNKKCEEFNHPFADQSRIDKALLPAGKGVVFCPACGTKIILFDLIEKRFDSAPIKEQAMWLAEESQYVIDNESRELMLVGHAMFITAEAGQIYRGYTNSDYGIDAEIEFKDDQGNPSGHRLYLQLKSGDSYLKKRKGDGAEIFHISNSRWVDYWQAQSYPVMLVIRPSNGDIRWMDVSEYLKRATEGGTKPVSQIDFTGERFDATSIRKWRSRIILFPLSK